MSDLLLWPLAVYSIAVLILVVGMIVTPYLLGERHWRKPERRGEIGTAVPYESGIFPTGSARLRLPIQYYLVAMFFVIFDLEAVFIVAWAVAVPETGWLGFGEMAVFIGILLAALAYLWRVGALDWGAQYGLVQARRRPAGEREHEVVVQQRERLRATG